jgi:hypothetical protein
MRMKERSGFIERGGFAIRDTSIGIGILALFVSTGIAFAALCTGLLGHEVGESAKR